MDDENEHLLTLKECLQLLLKMHVEQTIIPEAIDRDMRRQIAWAYARIEMRED